MKKRLLANLLLVSSITTLTGCGGEETTKGIAPQKYTDSLFAVMKADRTNYTKLVVKRLGPKGANAVKPDEHWQDIPNGTLLPAQNVPAMHFTHAVAGFES